MTVQAPQPPSPHPSFAPRRPISTYIVREKLDSSLQTTILKWCKSTGGPSQGPTWAMAPQAKRQNFDYTLVFSGLCLLHLVIHWTTFSTLLWECPARPWQWSTSTQKLASIRQQLQPRSSCKGSSNNILSSSKSVIFQFLAPPSAVLLLR
jgi:hypothetical protein